MNHGQSETAEPRGIVFALSSDNESPAP